MRRAWWAAVAALAVWASEGDASAAPGCLEPTLAVKSHATAGSDAPDHLTVVSINLAKQNDAARIAAELRELGLLDRADVLSLQEVPREGAGESVAEQLAHRLGMGVAVAGAGADGAGVNADAIALLSRSALEDPAVLALPRNELGVRSRCRVALAATVRGVRIVGLHLDTRVNAERRLEQVRPIVEAAADFEGPVVLAGDFNTNSFFWIEHLIPVPFMGDQAAAMLRHLEGLGYSTPFPLGGRATNDFLGLQLDWVFLRGLEATDWGVEPLGFSDHHAVWVRAATQ